MKNFDIIKRGDFLFVQSISYNNPINDLVDIANELHKIKYEGEVVFDLLLINGNCSNRFILSKFLNKQFEMKSFKKTNIAIDIKQEIILYYKNHKEYLSDSILSSSTISAIINERYLPE